MIDELKDLRKIPNSKKLNVVSYYPVFESQSSLENHYFRAKWYMPYVLDVLDKVVMPYLGSYEYLAQPEYMCSSDSEAEHIEIVSDEQDYLDALVKSKIILVWQKISEDERDTLDKHCQVFDITTDNLETVEYGLYCKILWQMTTKEQKEMLLESSHSRFKKFAMDVRNKNYCGAAVFGTGPSVETANQFDFSNCYTHACNTVVQSKELLDVIDPDIISAGDVVSHFGVSAYAQKFREDLASAMSERGFYFLTTAQFGYLFMVHYPELKDKILLCEQRGFIINCDLEKDWNLPIMDSTFNIHMMPSAFTMSDTVFVLGCDGKNPDDSKNEDFWEHSAKAQYHDLVDSGHLAHPTFDIHRQRSTWDGYVSSVIQTCGLSEALYGKKIISLAQSYTPGLTERSIKSDALKVAYPWIVSQDKK